MERCDVDVMFLPIQGRAMLMWLCAQLVLQDILVFMDLGRGFGAIALLWTFRKILC